MTDWRPLGPQPAAVLCIYCQQGRHDQCVSHRTGFEFCICPASVESAELVTMTVMREVAGSNPAVEVRVAAA